MSGKYRMIILECGPGDPELVTLKGIRAVQEADMILYNSLIPALLVEYASPTCQLICIDNPESTLSAQKDICEFATRKIFQRRNVVWLKGRLEKDDDESLSIEEYFKRKGVQTEIIPGISSALAAPSSIGVPVTRRGVNESFFVVNTPYNRLSETSRENLHIAARSSATVIMQLKNDNDITEIIKIFRQTRGEFENAAIVQNATLPEQTFVQGTLASIETFAFTHKADVPAIIIIGKVVNENSLQRLSNEGKVAVI